MSAVFIDYDNIYLSLKRKNEEAAKRFAKDAGLWLKEIESGRLITSTNGPAAAAARRIVLNRCYGNPVPRRNASDNSTDMNSFPFVRHHFLRAGMEAIDCPPLTSQLKNSADIRMVMDVRDLIDHDTYYDEFIILSGDADFTPLLHRLRAHARRTVVFANDHTATPYTAIADGEIRESHLINLLVEGRQGSLAEAGEAADESQVRAGANADQARTEILSEVVGWVRNAGQPVPLEALADRAVRTLGHDRTVGTSWGGAGSFSALLAKGLPSNIRLSDQPPYYVYDASRQMVDDTAGRRLDTARAAAPIAKTDATRSDAPPRYAPLQEPLRREPAAQSVSPPRSTAAPASRPSMPGQTADPEAGLRQTLPPLQPQRPLQGTQGNLATPRDPAPQPARAPQRSEGGNSIQQSITRIHDACQAPPLAPPEYRALFEVMAQEITANGLMGAQTISNIAARAADMGVDVRRDDIRFVLEIVSEADPWFEQGASANLFSSRFRNFVIARCRGQGLQLSSEELDLIDAWFGGSPAPLRAPLAGSAARPAPEPQSQVAPGTPQRATAQPGDRWWSIDEGRDLAFGHRTGATGAEEMPLIVRNRLRG